MSATPLKSRTPQLKSRRSLARSVSGRSEERRVGKECRSRCDWSSDVCSSDLLSCGVLVLPVDVGDAAQVENAAAQIEAELGPIGIWKIGRASCRERV